MRPFFISVILCLPGMAVAQSVPAEDAASDTGDFRLGGAASRAAIVATTPTSEIEPARSARPSLPLNLTGPDAARMESTLGPATVFLSDGMDAGRDALELGTFLSRGQASAGLSVTVVESEDDVTRSEVFLDYAVTEQFSVGVSGIFDTEDRDDEPLRQLGVNAEFSTQGGTFIQGGFASTPDYDPVIGLSIGLRF